MFREVLSHETSPALMPMKVLFVWRMTTTFVAFACCITRWHSSVLLRFMTSTHDEARDWVAKRPHVTLRSIPQALD